MSLGIQFFTNCISMTTITNFLSSNFVMEQSSEETPAWVILPSHPRQAALLKKQLITNSLIHTKPLIHIDLGITTRRSQLPHAPTYFLINAPTLTKCQPGYLLLLTAQLKSMENYGACGVLLEGLSAFLTLTSQRPESLHELQNFISTLQNASASFRQITIISSPSLPRKLQFVLERSSTCLSVVNGDALQNGMHFTCSSTVRRHTGYSKEQSYTIDEVNGKVKVMKLKQKEQENTESQKQMLQELGFGVKRTEGKEELRDMIYPHLRMRKEGCKDCNGQCSGQCSGQAEIVLDDEQDDDGDIDV